MVNIRKSLDTQIYDQEELPGIPRIRFPSEGMYHALDRRQLKTKKPKLFYSHRNGEIWHGYSLL